MMMSGRCLMFKPFQTPYQSPISDLPKVINLSIQYQINQNFYALSYIFYDCRPKCFGKYLWRRTLAWFCSQSTWPAWPRTLLILRGGLEGKLVLTVRVSSGWTCHVHINQWIYQFGIWNYLESNHDFSLLVPSFNLMVIMTAWPKKTETIPAHSHWWILRLY